MVGEEEGGPGGELAMRRDRWLTSSEGEHPVWFGYSVWGGDGGLAGSMKAVELA